MNTREEGEEVIVERWLAAPPERVWRYFTEGDQWVLWQGASARIDPRPGGTIDVRMTSDGEAGARGEFLLLEWPRRLLFTWGWVDAPFGEVPPGSTRVEVVLTPEAGGTRLRITHSGLPEGLHGIHDEGWRFFIERLATLAGNHPAAAQPGA